MKQKNEFETKRLIVLRYDESYFTYEKLLYGNMPRGKLVLMTPVNIVSVHSQNSTLNKADLGWQTMRDHQNKGFLKEALKAIIPDIFRIHNKLDFLRVWVSKTNPYGEFSKRAALSVGFTHTHDDENCWWAKLKREEVVQ